MSLTVIINSTFVTFCSMFRISPIAKKTDSSSLPNVVDDSVLNQSLAHNLRFHAIALAVYYFEEKIIYAVLAPKTAQDGIKKKWNVAEYLNLRLKSRQQVFICVPLECYTSHLPLEDCVLR